MAMSLSGTVTGTSSNGRLAIELRDLSLKLRPITVLAPDSCVAVLCGMSFGGTLGGGDGGVYVDGPA